MKTEHILLGAATIGAAAYLIHSKSKSDNGGDLVTDAQKAQNELDNAKDQIDGASCGSGAPNMSGRLKGRSLHGEILSPQTITAVVALEEAQAAVLAAKSSLMNEYIKLYQSGKTTALFKEEYQKEIAMGTLVSISQFLYDLIQNPSFQPIWKQDEKTLTVKNIIDILEENAKRNYEGYEGIYIYLREYLNSITTQTESYVDKLGYEAATLFNLYLLQHKAQIELDDIILQGTLLEKAKDNPQAYDPEMAKVMLERYIAEKAGISLMSKNIQEAIRDTPSCVSNINAKAVEAKMGKIQDMGDAMEKAA
jgi:hypothetical protein